MKRTNSYIVLILFLITTLFIGCQTQTEKIQLAEEKVIDATQDLEEAESHLSDVIDDSVTTYQNFKYEAEIRISSFEKKIGKLRLELADADAASKAKLEEDIRIMEQKNMELKKKLADYREGNTTKWDSFKLEFNRDLSELGKAIKDFTVSNSKN